MTTTQLNDTLDGTQGNDTLTGTTADDIIFGRAGNDVLYGGGTGDQPSGNDLIIGGGGNDVIYGGYNLSNHDTLIGGDGNDTITGNDGGNVINGGEGNDVINASGLTDSGANTILGGNGDDHITLDTTAAHANGGAGNDVITVNDTNTIASDLPPSVIKYMEAQLHSGIAGGEGHDSFKFNFELGQFTHHGAPYFADSHYTVTDFNVAEDTLHISSYDDKSGHGALDQSAVTSVKEVMMGDRESTQLTISPAAGNQFVITLVGVDANEYQHIHWA